VETENNTFAEVLVDDSEDIAAELALIGVPSKPAQKKPASTKAPKPAIKSTTKQSHLMQLFSNNCAAIPGLVGDIARNMLNTAYAPLPQAALAAALQAVSSACRGINGFNRVDTGLITLLIAPSGGGKEHPQKKYDELMVEIGVPVAGEARGDAELLYAIADRHGHLVMRVDEAHAFFSCMQDSKAGVWQRNMGALILKASANSTLKLSPNQTATMQDRFAGHILGHEKAIAAITEREGRYSRMSNEEAEREIQNHTAMIEECEKRVKAFKLVGIENVYLNLMCSSTPEMFREYIDSQSVNNGLAGRALIFDCGSHVIPSLELWPDSNPQAFSALIGRLAEVQLRACSNHQIAASSEAQGMLKSLVAHYKHDNQYNHLSLGAVYRRATERLYSLCSIMAAEKGIITPEIVQAAHALVEMHINNVDHLLIGAVADSNEINAERAVKARILEIIKGRTTPIYWSKVKGKMLENAKLKAAEREYSKPVMKIQNGRRVKDGVISLTDKCLSELVDKGFVLMDGKTIIPTEKTREHFNK